MKKSTLFWLLLAMTVTWLLDMIRVDDVIVYAVNLLSSEWPWWQPAVAEAVVLIVFKAGFVTLAGVSAYIIKTGAR